MKQNFDERRRHSRLLLSLPMHLQWGNEEGVTFNKKSNSINISTGGVYYKSPEDFPLDTDITVTFFLPIDDAADSNFRILRAQCKVVRVEDLGTVKDKGMALKFVDELKFSSSYS